MRRAKIVRSTIEELRKRISIAEKAKKEYTDYLYNIHDRYEKGYVSYSDYLEALYEKKDGRNIQEWISYLDSYIEYCKQSLKEPKKDLVKHKLTIIFFSFMLILLAFVSTIYLRPEFAGFLVQDPAELQEVVSEANVTIDTTQFQAVLGEPVKWKKTISLNTSANVTVRLPVEATNISVNKITESYSEEQKKALQNRTSPSHEELFSSEAEAKFSITGGVTGVEGGSRILNFFKNIPRLTGRIIGQEQQETIEIEIEENATEYEIEYETPAPYAIEEPIEKGRGKRIKIMGPETIHYENVLTFTNLPENLNIRNPSQVKIHWIENNSFVPIQNIRDTDNNGIYDYIEWLTPSLSEATFDIIVIIKAEHLDKNREFISDIYEQVKELDDVWSETIENQDYVRVQFEIPLTNQKDITIYPRVVSGNPRIEVYEFNQNELIAEFTNVNSNEYNKIFLTDLISESQDVFDLRIVEGSLEFDHIIDPFVKVTNGYEVGGMDVADNEDDGSYRDETTCLTDSNGGGECVHVDILGGQNNDFALKINRSIDPSTLTDLILRINVSSESGGDNIFIYPYATSIAINTSVNVTSTIVVNGTNEYNLTEFLTSGSFGESGRYSIRVIVEGNNHFHVSEAEVLETVAGGGDTEQPKWQKNQTNSTEAGTLIIHSVNWTDDTALDGFIFSFDNGTGTFVNDTFVDMIGVSNFSNVTKYVNQTANSTIRWIIYANDSSNNFNNTDTFIYNTTDTVAPNIEFISPTTAAGNFSQSYIEANVTASDFNLDIITIFLFNSSGLVQQNTSSSSPFLSNFTGLIDGTYFLNATANDTTGNVNKTENRTMVLDTTSPVIGQKFVNTTSVNTNEAIRLNVTGVTDNIQIDTVYTTITYPNNTIVNVTMTSIGGNVFAHNLSVGDTAGTFHYNTTFVNDTAGNLASNTTILSVTVTALNTAPTIDIVEVISAQSPIEAGNRSITFNFTATDTDGGSDINVSTAEARFQRSGEGTRLNLSCNSGDVDGNNLNFTCVIDMTYFDENGAWTINVTVRDNAGETAENSSTTFTYNLLTAMVMSPTALGWPTVNLPDVDTGSTSDPITINNTGNAVNLNINITALDLQGELTTSEHIFAENFTVENISEGCGVGATAMINATQVNVTSLILQRGNNDLGSGQEEVFFCLKGVPQDITAQPYSSTALGSWTIRILLVSVIPARRRRRKKKNIKDDKLIKALNLIADELKEEYSLNKKEIIKVIIEKLKTKYKVSRRDILEIIKAREELNIPSTIFSKELGGLEAITKYMRENLNMNYHEIARELGRDERTIWTSYKKAIEKQKEKIEIKETEIFLPISIFENKELTILESIIVYLKEKGLKYSEIAELLDRDQRNIWTIYSRAIKKLEKHE